MDDIKSIQQMEEMATTILPKDVFEYLNGGADDLITVKRNSTAYQAFQLRPRRMVDVSQINTSVEIFGEKWNFPFAVAPVGLQAYFHPEGEIATAKAAANAGSQMVVSTVSNYSYSEIAEHFNRPPWFQLYPTTNRKVTEKLIETVEGNGCKVLVLTADVPVLGNRQTHRKHLVDATESGLVRLGNLDGVKGNEAFNDPSISWDFIKWIRDRSKMKIVLKGVMTAEDAVLSIDYGLDGIIVSNHGGRQLESNLSTIEVLEEVCGAVQNTVPVMIDGGIRRGTDIIKAIALGAKAAFIGRPICYGLSVNGEQGVAKVLHLLQEEIARNMQLLGVTDIDQINSNHIRVPKI